MKTYKAGTILINKEKKQIGLVYSKRRKDLTFPKGHLEGNETLINCALRETKEETTHLCHLEDENPVEIIKYIINNDEEIEVHYFLAFDDGKSEEVSSEKEILVYINVDDVEEALSYDNLKNMWKKVKYRVEKIIEE
ncbi:MAG: NUDIX domain-containing protein [Bacilli bacterium]|nr:NUDIX domain-containing protein [Bacilli bacterium]